MPGRPDAVLGRPAATQGGGPAVEPPSDRAAQARTANLPTAGKGDGEAAVNGAARPGTAASLGSRYRAQKRDFLGIGLSCMSDEALVAAVDEAVRSRSRLTVAFVNPDTILRGHKIPGLSEKLNWFDIVLPDGWGV